MKHLRFGPYLNEKQSAPGRENQGPPAVLRVKGPAGQPVINLQAGGSLPAVNKDFGFHILFLHFSKVCVEKPRLLKLSGDPLVFIQLIL